jgi:hypothetical protein
MPDHPRVVPVPRGDEPAGLGDPVHLAQRPHRIPYVLQHLMRVDDVEGVVRVVQRVHVRDRELDVPHAPFDSRGPGLVQDARRLVDAGDPAVGDQVRQVCGDGAGPAADVQDRHMRLQ